MNKAKMKCSILMITLILMLVLNSTTVNMVMNVYGDTTPKIYVDPPSINNPGLTPGSFFQIDVKVADVSPDRGVSGWELVIRYDFEVLYTNDTLITEGDFLKNVGSTMFTKTLKPAESGWALVCLLLLPGAASGSGTLATVKFKVLDLGGTDLKLLLTKLKDEEVWDIPHTVEHGWFQNAPLPPKAFFTYSPLKPLAEQPITFNASDSYDPDGSIVSWDWDFDDDTTDTGEIVTHAYTSAGSYTVNLTVTDNDALKDWQTMTVGIPNRDVAITGVTFSPKAAMAGTPIYINVTVENKGEKIETFNVTTYYFNATLPPAEIDTIQDVTLQPPPDPMPTEPPPGGWTHNITLAFPPWYTTGVSLGTYTIKANATLVPGETNKTNNELIDGTLIIATTNTYNFQVTVGGVTLPVIVESNATTIEAFSFNRSNKEISFNATGPSGVVAFCNVTIARILLDGPFTLRIDNNLIDSSDYTVMQNTTHSFLYFTFILSTHKIQIQGTSVATPPIASFTMSKTEAAVGEKVTFDATASYDPDGHIVSYFWDFGDKTNTTTTEQIVNHTYTSVGKPYTVTLKVTDNATLTNSATKGITVKLGSAISIAVSPPTVTVGESVVVNGSITPVRAGKSVTIWHRLFGQGTWSELKKETTDSYSRYSYNWITTTIGTYEVKANWTGDVNTLPAESEIKNVTIGRASSTISIAVSSTAIAIGESVVVNGSITPVRAGKSVTIWHRLSGQETWSNLTSALTDENSRYSYSWAPATPGVYEVKASWTGDVNTLPAESEIKTLTVKSGSTISIDVSPTTVTVDKTVTVNGSLTPARIGVTVTIWYRLSGEETWSNLTTALTDENSRYSYSWTPTAPGVYEIKASWTGDVNTLSAESAIKTVTVKEAPSNATLYVVAGIAVVSVAAIIVYFVRFKKPKKAMS